MADSLRNILSAIARLSGLRRSERRQLAAYSAKLAEAKAGNIDNLESVKTEIRQIEEEARRLGNEHAKSAGQTREIILKEIELMFRDLDQRRERIAVISQNIENISMAQEKIRAIEAAAAKGMADGEFDDIAESVRQEFADLKESDKAARELAQEKYQQAPQPQMDTQARMAELTPDKTGHAELPPEIRKRLESLRPDPQ